MMRTLLARGMLAGLAAAALAFVFASVVGEPALEGGIEYEHEAAHAAGELADHHELVSRGIQATVGLGVALAIYGIAIGGILALVYAAVHGRVGALGPRATAAVLALVGYVAVVLVPMLKYPSNPPGSSLDGTIGWRTSAFLVMLGLSVAAVIGAAAAVRPLVARLGTWNGVLVAGVGYVVVMGVVGGLMPTVAETPADFPAVVLYDFRVATFGMHLVLWAAVGLVFGALAERAARQGTRAGAPVGAGSLPAG